MHLGIELRPISPGASGGIAMVLQGVLNRLYRQFPADHFHIFTTLYSRGLLDVDDLPHVTVHPLTTRTFFAEMDRLMAAHDIRALFRAYPVSDDSNFPLSRQIILIPDVQHEHRPDFFDRGVLRCRRAAFNRFLADAGAIGTISTHAKNEILALPMTRCRDIFLMPPALTERHQPVDLSDLTDDERARLPDVPFFYFPANLWAHKNHRRLLEAFKRALEKSKQPMRLILTGHPDGFDALMADFPGLPVAHLGFVRPQLVRMLLQRATALTFFSQYEGFGIPLLEAFSAGCPVVCSNTTSLPEVAGDAAVLVDPTDIGAMADAMLRMVGDGALRDDLIAKGHGRLGVWTWERSAEALRAAFDRVAPATAPSPSLASSRVGGTFDREAPAPAASTSSTPSRLGGAFDREGSAPGPSTAEAGRAAAGKPSIFHNYWHQKGFTIPRAYCEVRRRVSSLVLGRSVWNTLSDRVPAVGRWLDRLQIVRGLRADHSIAPITRIVLREKDLRHTSILGGTADCNAALTISTAAGKIARFELSAGRRTRMTFEPPADGGAITLRLSPTSTRFVLDETNLFTENDVY